MVLFVFIVVVMRCHVFCCSCVFVVVAVVYFHHYQLVVVFLVIDGLLLVACVFSYNLFIYDGSCSGCIEVMNFDYRTKHSSGSYQQE